MLIGGYFASGGSIFSWRWWVSITLAVTALAIPQVKVYINWHIPGAILPMNSLIDVIRIPCRLGCLASATPA
jgi:hypothetical protein